MQKQAKLLNKAYLEAQLTDIKEIRRKEVRFDIHESDRAFSQSLYVTFYWQTLEGYWFGGVTVRISDHKSKKNWQVQFIVDPNDTLTKKVKERFRRTLQNAVKKTQLLATYKKIEHLPNMVDKEPQE